MHIHNYQIHNILNVYRRQLSQPVGPGKAKMMVPAGNDDLIDISTKGKRQSIFDKISTEIVDRITQFDSTPQFKSIMEDKLSLEKDRKPTDGGPNATQFSYNLIDENNRKIPNTLTFQPSSPLARFSGSTEDAEGPGEAYNEAG